MTREQYIQYLRQVVTTAKLDSIGAEGLSRMQSRYGAAINELFNELANYEYAIKSGRDVEQLGRRLNQLILQSDIIEAMTNDVADITTAAGTIAYPDYNDIISWDGRVKGFNEVTRAADEIKEQVMIAQIGDKKLAGWMETIFGEDNVDSAVSAVLPDFVDMIETGRMKGEGYRELVRRLGAEFSDYSRADLITITRSYVQSMNVQAHTDVYNANLDIVKGVQWNAVLEVGDFTTGRGTCPRCAALDGEQYLVNEVNVALDAPACPLHPRCRCLLLPITPTWRELGFDIDEMEQAYRPWVERTEEAIDAGGQRQILEHGRFQGTYADWWLQSPESYQDRVVGVQRARLIRNDSVPFNGIVDRNGNLIPIDWSEDGRRSLRDIYQIPDDVMYFARTGKPFDPTGGSGTGGAAGGAAAWFDAYSLTGLGRTWVERSAPIMSAEQQAVFERILAMDGDLDVRMGEMKRKGGEKGAFYRYQGDYKGYIHMKTGYYNNPTARGDNTWLHEFGHLADYRLADEVSEAVRGKHPSFGTPTLSGARNYFDAYSRDRAIMGTWDSKDWKLLGGTGRASKQKLMNEYANRGFEIRGEIRNRLMDTTNYLELSASDAAKAMTAALEAQCEKELKGDLLGLYKLTRLQKPIASYNNALTELLISQRYGTRSNLGYRWMVDGKNWTADNNGSHFQFLADLLGASTHEKYGYGHGRDYYNTVAGRHQRQAFANLFLTSNDPLNEAFYNIFTPNQWRAFQEIFKDMQ